jgi:nicotinate-nucleotide adenylyltransferase
MNGYNIGILGGTFNPIHIGHLILAQSAVEDFELNRVVFVPCASPPHKLAPDLVDGRHRLDMVSSAIASNPVFDVSDIELRREGVSYAIDTVKALSAENPDSRFFFIVGSDMLPQLYEWRNIYELLQRCRFITFARPGYDAKGVSASDLNLAAPWPERLMQDITVSRQFDVSSTDIRYRIAEGLSIQYLVPPEVEMYINEHNLYLT